MQPAVRITAEGADITARVQDRLVSLTVTDEAGEAADTAEFTLDDRDSRIALPPPGAVLEIALGFAGAPLTGMGHFVVDELSGQAGPDRMTIRAKAPDMGGGIRARKTRNWNSVTLDGIVRTIAEEHGLIPAVAPDPGAVAWDWLAQTSESDLNFLTRLARELDAVAKPAGGRLVVVRRGDSRTAAGDALPVFTVDRRGMSSLSWTLAGRGKYGQVTAEWDDTAAATTRRVTAGDREPELVMRHRHASEAEARRAAEAELARVNRGSGKLSVALGGFYGDLLAGAQVRITGIRPELSGMWLVSRVRHSLGQTLATSFEAERDNAEKGT